MYGQFSAYGSSIHSGIEWMTYDRNGNIRRKYRTYAMNVHTNDQYSYPSNSNRLSATINGSKRTSYTYNAMGQMTAMDKTGTAASTNALLDHQAVTYNSDGLVKEIRNGDNVVYFKYDPNGMLVEKLSLIAGTMATTRYARDASGNVLAMLNGSWGCGQGVCGKGPIDFPVYGSSRIGSLHSKPSPTAINPSARQTELEYELTDHLGNVRATFTRDALTKVTLASSADYYPYGTKIPGSWTRAGGAYRYGYQGQYAEDNTDETGYSNFEARMLDNERARWFVPDPAQAHWSPYLAMGNNPIIFADPDGRDIVLVNDGKTLFGLGHMAMLIGNNKDGWTYYSKGGREGGSSEGSSNNAISGGPAATTKFIPYSSLNQFFKDQSRYTDYVYIKSDNDGIMRKTAEREVTSRYNLFVNNCADAVTATLEAGGINGGIDFYSTLLDMAPSVRINTIAMRNDTQVRPIPRTEVGPIFKGENQVQDAIKYYENE